MMELLADRDSNGIAVSLFWDHAAAPGRDVVIEYCDRLEGIAYTLRPARKDALDAFYHPNCYLTGALVAIMPSPRAASSE
jgi:hypothetical protein